jgi:TPR repeat protein
MSAFLNVTSGKRKSKRRLVSLPNSFIARVEDHPALFLAGPEFVTELAAHPMHCLASQHCLQRLEGMFCFRVLSQAHVRDLNIYGFDVVLRQCRALIMRAALSKLLVQRLIMNFQGACCARNPLNLAKHILSRRHFLGRFKNQQECLFQEGHKLYGQEHYVEAAKRWGQAALLEHMASHAYLSIMLVGGKPGLPRNHERAFELATHGARMGCAHSKGALGIFYQNGFGGVAEDCSTAFALGSESAEAGSCFGQYVVGAAFHWGLGVERDKTEAARWYRLAAAQGHSGAQYGLGDILEYGVQNAQEMTEAVEWYGLAAKQGDADAQFKMGYMLHYGQGVQENMTEAERWYRLAALQGHSIAKKKLKGLTAKKLKAAAAATP